MKSRTLEAIKKLVIAALLVGSPTVFAQGDTHGAPMPIDDTTGPHTSSPNSVVVDPHHHDPTLHYNWAGNWFSYRNKDIYGGPIGDGKMVDHDGRVVMQKKHKTITNADGTKQHVVVVEVAEEQVMSPPFVFMLLNFGIVLLILAKYGGPAARKLAEERHDQIKAALDEAAKLRDQAQNKLTEYETRIKDVDAEVKKLVDGIRADAEADKARILETAQKQAVQMKKDAEQRIAAEIEFARASLQREVAVAASGATEKLLREKLTNDDQSKLVTTFIGNVQSTPKEAR